MYSTIVFGITLLVALEMVGVEGSFVKQLVQWLKGGEEDGKFFFNVYSYEGEELEPMEIDWMLERTNLGKLWSKLKAKYENDIYKIEEMVLPVYDPSQNELHWITYDPKKLDQIKEEPIFKKIMISIFGRVWLTSSTPKILLYLKPKSEPENEFTVKVFKAEVQDGARGVAESGVTEKAKLGEVKFTVVNLDVGEVTDLDIWGKVSEKWPGVTRIHVMSFSNGSNSSIHEGTMETPPKKSYKSYGVRGLRLEIELAEEPKK